MMIPPQISIATMEDDTCKTDHKRSEADIASRLSNILFTGTKDPVGTKLEAVTRGKESGAMGYLRGILEKDDKRPVLGKKIDCLPLT